MISPFDHIDWDVGDAAALEKRLFSELIGLEAVRINFHLSERYKEN